MMAAMRPWTDDEKHTIQATMEAVYKVFVRRASPTAARRRRTR